MVQELDNHDVAAELVFDVSKGSENVQFLGFVTGLEELRNDLVGLFAWTCQGCTCRNRSSTLIRPTQAFLVRWLCASCGKVTLVQFRSRASAEWVVQHAVAVTGSAFGETAEPAPAVGKRNQRTHAGQRARQRVFALLTIPALALIIALALSDLPSAPFRWGRGSEQGAWQSDLAPSLRLPGCWVSETGGHSLYFGRIDPVSKMGSYVPILKSRPSQPWVRFTIVHEDVDRAEMVIRDLDENGNVVPHSETVLHLPKQGGTLIRVSMEGQSPELTVYRPVGSKGAPHVGMYPAK
jgi:hypothetical protein